MIEPAEQQQQPVSVNSDSSLLRRCKEQFLSTVTVALQERQTAEPVNSESPLEQQYIS